MRATRLVAPWMLAAVLVMPAPVARAQMPEMGTYTQTECWWEGPKIGPFELFSPDDSFACGYVTAPKRHADPDGPTIRIPVAVRAATFRDSDNPPLFLAQGGPGGSALEVFSSLLLDSSIGDARDVVIFNQRGTSFAEPDLTCTESFDAAPELWQADEDEFFDLSLEVIAECRDRLVGEGIDLSAFNSVENAADVPVIAAALGYGPIDFYGVSYGTLLGLHLMRDHPDAVRSVILDAVVPTQLNFIPEVPASQERLWSEVFDHCGSDPVCSDDYPDLEQRLFALVDRLDDEPLTATLEDPDSGDRAEVTLTGSALLDLMFVVMYQPGNYAFAPRMISEIERGDLTAVEFYLPLLAFDRTLSEGMYYSVLCAEDADFTLADANLDAVRPEFADPAEDYLGFVLDVCEVFDVDELDAVVDEPVVSDIPALLLSGQFDPITPPSNGDLAAETLSSSTHVVHPYGSHGVAFDDPCIDEIIQDFLADPGAELDTSCVAAIEPEETVPADAVTMSVVGGFAQLDSSFLLAFAVTAVVLLLTYTTLPVAIGLAIRQSVRRPPTPAPVLLPPPSPPPPFGVAPPPLTPPPFTPPAERSESTPGPKLIRWPAALTVAALYGLAGTVLAVGLIVVLFDTVFNRLPYLAVLALPGGVRWLLAIPWLLTILAGLMVVIAVRRWMVGEWSLWGKLYYTPLAAAAVIGVVVAANQGLLRF